MNYNNYLTSLFEHQSKPTNKSTIAALMYIVDSFILILDTKKKLTPEEQKDIARFKQSVVNLFSPEAKKAFIEILDGMNSLN